ncbi:MAG: TonB family protein [Nitrospira sp.]|nr:TonB family protein [Nitrospira sp.]MBH0181315.1 TonB family protein [Nitrospira sp.]MBH0185700.1 TonB family protein [Nitrospira sp.]
MRLPCFRSVALMAGLFWACLGGPVFQPELHAASHSNAGQPGSQGNHRVVFDFAGLDASGDIRVGSPLKLSLTLYGTVQSHTPLIAICESIHFERQVVTMEADSRSMEMHATAILEPIAPGKLSVSPKAARIQVTFARAQADKKPERVMKRIIYVTLGTPTPQSNHADRPPPRLYEPGEEDAGDDDLPPEVTPIADNSLAEENLLPLPAPGPGPGPAYWQHVSTLLSQSWGRTAHQVRHTPSSETVHVRFRMYPNGRAQLIQIEKGSGSREINEAGIYAVVDAQPFPPFPDHVGSEPVDVHVRMRTGARPSPRDVRPASASTAR